MNEKHFLLNLDRIAEGRTAEHPGDAQAIVKGKILMHYLDPNASEVPGTFSSVLILAIEAEPLKELFTEFYNEANPDSTMTVENARVTATSDLSEYYESEAFGPDHLYAAIMIERAIV